VNERPFENVLLKILDLRNIKQAWKDHEKLLHRTSLLPNAFPKHRVNRILTSLTSLILIQNSLPTKQSF